MHYMSTPPIYPSLFSPVSQRKCIPFEQGHPPGQCHPRKDGGCPLSPPGCQAASCSQTYFYVMYKLSLVYTCNQTWYPQIYFITILFQLHSLFCGLHRIITVTQRTVLWIRKDFLLIFVHPVQDLQPFKSVRSGSGPDPKTIGQVKRYQLLLQLYILGLNRGLERVFMETWHG